MDWERIYHSFRTAQGQDLSALKKADYVFISGKKNKDIENKIFSKNEKIKIFYSNYKPQNIDKFQDKKIVAFAGIGNPEIFLIY